MENFLYFLVAFFALDIVGKAYCLYKRDTTRTDAGVALDLVFNVGVLTWVVWLLAKI